MTLVAGARGLGKRLYHTAALPALAASGGLAALRWAQRHAALVLMYHGVVGPRSSPDPIRNENDVTAGDLVRQLEFLGRHYAVVPLHEIVTRLRRGASRSRLAAVTFDDGYASVETHAAPIPNDLGLPATVFVIAGLAGTGQATWYDAVEQTLLNHPGRHVECPGRRYDLGRRRGAIWELTTDLTSLPIAARDEAIAALLRDTGGDRWPRDDAYRLLDWPAIAGLHRRAIAVGVHSYSHPNLSGVAPAQLDRQIGEAAEPVGRRVGVPVRDPCFSYPDGDHTALVRGKVAAAGMLGAVTTRDAPVSSSTDPYAIPRVGVYPHYSQAMFEDATAGMRRAQELLAPYRGAGRSVLAVGCGIGPMIPLFLLDRNRVPRRRRRAVDARQHRAALRVLLLLAAHRAAARLLRAHPVSRRAVRRGGDHGVARVPRRHPPRARRYLARDQGGRCRARHRSQSPVPESPDHAAFDSSLLTRIYRARIGATGAPSPMVRHEYAPRALDASMAAVGFTRIGRAFYDFKVVCYPVSRAVPRLAFAINQRIETGDRPSWPTATSGCTGR
jgi:peptidoglycan/xylan/chitin deacetylase (PgdA/CDA1 family)